MSFRKLPGTAAWRHGDGREGFEVVSITVSDASYRLDGHTAAVEAGQAWVVRYVISLDEEWITKGARVWGWSSTGHRERWVESDGSGRWHVNGTPAPEYDGCIDVDLESSSVTNTIPVHRLDLAVGRQPRSRPCMSGPWILALSDSTSTTSERTTTVRTNATTTAHLTSASRLSSSTMNSGWCSNIRASRPASSDSTHQIQRWAPDSIENRCSTGSLLGGCVQGCLYLVDRGLLGIAHVLTVLTVSSGNFLGQRDDEPTVLVHLRRRGLAFKQSDRIT